MVAMRCTCHDGTRQVGSFYVRQPIRTPTLLQALPGSIQTTVQRPRPRARAGVRSSASLDQGRALRSSSVRFALMMMPVLHCTVCARCLSRRHLRFELRRTRLQRSYPELGIRATRVVRSTVPWRVLSLPVLRTRTPATRPDVRTCVVATSWDTRQPECVFSSTAVTCSRPRAFLHVFTRTSIDSRIFLTPASLTLSGVSPALQIATQSMSMHRTAPRLYEAHPHRPSISSLSRSEWLHGSPRNTVRTDLPPPALLVLLGPSVFPRFCRSTVIASLEVGFPGGRRALVPRGLARA